MRILLAYDGSAQADKALERAIDLAGKLDVDLAVVSVTADLCLPMLELTEADCHTITHAYAVETQGLLDKATARATEKGIRVEGLLREGDPAEKILETAEEIGAELILVGSRGKSAARKFLFGSVSSKIAEHATCDVLIVR